MVTEQQCDCEGTGTYTSVSGDVRCAKCFRRKDITQPQYISKPDYQPGGETRVTSATGGQKGQKDQRLGGTDPLAMMELARVYGMGEQKYDRYNYLKGYAWSLSVDALLRHLFAFLSGEDRDPESGLLHTAHVAWHGLTLTSFQLRNVGEDDRAPFLSETDGIFGVSDFEDEDGDDFDPEGFNEPDDLGKHGLDPRYREEQEALARDAIRLAEKGYYKDAFVLLGIKDEDFGFGDGPVTECAPHCDHGIAFDHICSACWLTS